MSRFPKTAKIVLPGGAGLVGQNLVVLLKDRGYKNLTVIDKHTENTAILKNLHPDIQVIPADLAQPGAWENAIAGADIVIQLQAQISGLTEQDFIANNIESTKHLLSALDRNKSPYLVHVSSSVVTSKAQDFYTETKKAQEKLVIDSGIDHVILRPTLMFGWFDRKHLGWLARFMKKSPVFPVPGSGRYMRQPLYAMDFCRIIAACLEERPAKKIYNISGLEKIDYVDLIQTVKKTTNAKALIAHIPAGLFRLLLQIYGRFSKNPPFTMKQLDALMTPDEFETIDWPEIFSVPYTPLSQALRETFNHPVYSKITLDF